MALPAQDQTLMFREAAQAAQARLRTLGYDNGFIAPR